MNPDAFSDTIQIISRLQNRLDGVSSSEIQLFGYLACILYLYDGNPVSTWSYSFISNEYGGPFSKDIDDSINILISNGSIDTIDEIFFKMKEDATERYKTIDKFRTNIERIKYIKASCDSILMLPLGVLKQSLFNEPGLKSAININSKRLLLDEQGAAMDTMYEQFELIKKILGINNVDLLIPASTWLNVLYKSKKHAE